MTVVADTADTFLYNAKMFHYMKFDKVRLSAGQALTLCRCATRCLCSSLCPSSSFEVPGTPTPSSTLHCPWRRLLRASNPRRMDHDTVQPQHYECCFFLVVLYGEWPHVYAAL